MTSNTINNRDVNHNVDPLFPNRWSPRAMSGEDLTEEELMTLFEAARWAPSSYNNQPWRFIYAKRNTAHWDTFFNLLVEGNQTWAKNASVLIVLISKNTFDHNGKPATTHTLDAGAAWENLALQGTIRKLVVHGMQGFDYDKARDALKIPEEYTVEMMIAVGKQGHKETLPEPMQKGETPNDRKPISDIVMEGSFKE